MEIKTPFDKEQVELLNNYQREGKYHPYTCCSPEEIPECLRAKGESEGVLIAKEKGLICPCGKYTQNWAHLHSD